MRLVTWTRTVVDYILGSGGQPKMWLSPLPLPHGGCLGSAKIVILGNGRKGCVSTGTKHRNDSDLQFLSRANMCHSRKEGCFQ